MAGAQKPHLTREQKRALRAQERRMAYAMEELRRMEEHGRSHDNIDGLLVLVPGYPSYTKLLERERGDAPEDR